MGSVEIAANDMCAWLGLEQVQSGDSSICACKCGAV